MYSYTNTRIVGFRITRNVFWGILYSSRPLIVVFVERSVRLRRSAVSRIIAESRPRPCRSARPLSQRSCHGPLYPRFERRLIEFKVLRVPATARGPLAGGFAGPDRGHRNISPL